MRSATDPVVLDILRTQYGVISVTQARAAGLTAGHLRALVTAGRWERLATGVLGVAGHRPSWRRRLWTAVLHAGPESAVSHESAGRLQGAAEVPAGLVVVSVPPHRRPRGADTTWHRVRDLGPVDVVELAGLPVTSPARTVVDLAGVLHIARLRLLVEHGVVERRFGLDEIGSTLDRLRRNGRRGVARLGTVLDDLGPAGGIPNGELERLGDHAILLAGLPAPVHEHPLPGVGDRTGFVDRCWPEARMIVELDGRRWHARKQQMAADHDRVLQAQRAGYETTRLAWEHLSAAAASTAEALRVIYDRRLELVAGHRAG